MTQLPADPVSTVRQVYETWLAEVEILRHHKTVAPEAGPGEIREALLRTRGFLDRLEEIYSLSLAQRGAFRRMARDREAAADDNWDRLAATANQTGRGARDYEGSKERYARFNVDNFEHMRTARQWRQAADVADEITERIRLAYYGLRDTLMDLRESLRSFTMESSLDR